MIIASSPRVIDGSPLPETQGIYPHTCPAAGSPGLPFSAELADAMPPARREHGAGPRPGHPTPELAPPQGERFALHCDAMRVRKAGQFLFVAYPLPTEEVGQPPGP